jgi:hypothetical protein
MEVDQPYDVGGVSDDNAADDERVEEIPGIKIKPKAKRYVNSVRNSCSRSNYIFLMSTWI